MQHFRIQAGPLLSVLLMFLLSGTHAVRGLNGAINRAMWERFTQQQEERETQQRQEAPR